MKTTTLALLGALAFAPALSGCNTETASEEDTATVVNDDSLNGVVDLNDSLANEADADLDSAGAATGEALDATGEAIGAGVDSAGAAIGRAAEGARDAVDANVDLGRNAENQGN